MASEFLKRKAEERAKVIDQKYGKGTYGSTADLNKKRAEAKKETNNSSSTKSGGAKTEKSQASSVGSKVGSILGKTTAPTSNYSSAINLGLGPISKEKTIELVNSGQVTIDNNKFKWKNEPIKSTTTTIKSDIPEKERKARITQIDIELGECSRALSGISRAKAYGTNNALNTQEKNIKKRMSELEAEKKKLQRVGTFTSSEMKQFEIDDLKAKKNSLPTYNPTARIAPSGVEAYKNNLAAHSALDKEIDRLEREKAVLVNVERLDKLNAYTKQITSKSDFKAGSKYSPAKPKTAKELQAEGYKQAQDGSWYKNNLFGGTFYAGEDSDIYVYINDPSKRATIGANKRKESSKASTAFGGGAPSGGTDTYEMMGYHTLTDDEKGAFNYLYHQDRKNGTNKAMEYLNKISPMLQERAMKQEEERYKALSKDSPVLMSALSLGTNLANAAMFLPKAAATATGVYDEMPLLDMYGNRTTAIRGGVSEDMGDWGKLFYNAGMSIGDMGVAMLAGGGNAKAIQAVMSSAAGSSTISEAKQNGASDGKALVLGLGSAAIEWATEKYSVEAILKQPKTILGFIGTNVFTEATEEGASNISNMALDAIVSEVFGERNELEQRIDYLVLYEGKTEEEALQIAVNEKLQSLGEDVLVGGMTGFGMSGTKATAIAAQEGIKKAKTHRDVLNTYTKDTKSLNALIDSGKESGEGTSSYKFAQEVEQAQKEGTLSQSQVKQLIKVTDKQIKAESKAEDKTDTLDLAQLDGGKSDSIFDKLPLRERLRLVSEGSNVATADIKNATGFGDEGVGLVSSLMSDKGMNLDQAYSAVKTAYGVGFTNVEKKKVNFSNPLQEQAFDAGKIDRITQDAEDREIAKKATVYDGNFSEKYRENFNDDEFDMISKVVNDFGMEGSVVDEIIANEITDPVTGEVTKFRAAGSHEDGRLVISATTQKIIYKLVMHETGHRMKQLAPTEFGTLMDALYQRSMRRNNELGIDATANLDMIKAEHDVAGIAMSTGGYLEEFAVRELEDIFGSAEAFNKWVTEIDSDAKTKTAWDRFTNWLKEVFNDIKMRLSGMSKEERAKAKTEIAELDRIMELLEGTYKGARNAVAERKANQTESNANSESEIDFSLSPSKASRLSDIILEMSKIKKLAGDKEIRILTDEFSVKKALYSNKGRSNKEVNARIKAVPDFEAIIRRSTYSHTDTDVAVLGNSAKKGVIAMHYFKTTHNGFDVEVVVRDKGKKQFLYEVKFIENKKSSQQSMPVDTDSTAPKGDVGNDTKIPQKPNSVKSDFSLEDNLGYHAGDLGKSESLGQQGRYRDTGHFGTGTYFVGSKELVKDYNKRDGVPAPQHAVDFSDYNLYKVKNDKDGYALHRQLQIIDGGITEEWVKAAKDYEFSLYRSTEYYYIAEEKYGKEGKYTDEALIYGLTELAKKANIEIPTREQYSKESGYELTDEYFDGIYKDHLQEVVGEQIDTINEEYAEFRDAYSALEMRFGFSGKVYNAMNKVLEYQHANRRDTMDAYKKDSLATVFMKSLGYEGIDTRGTGLDNTAYGSVIYDVKKHTVQYSLEGEDLNKLSTEEKKAVDALGEGAKAVTDKNGKMLIATNKDQNTVMYSLETFNNGGKEALIKALRENGHTEAEIYETLSWVEDAADYLKILAAGYAKTHNYKALSDHLIADVITNVKTGKQVISSIVNNGDYPVNIDLALICKKRVAYMHLMNRLIDDGIFDKVNYGGEAIAKVNDLLRMDGFETACLGCFVESRRLQFQAWAETIVSEWNAEVDKRTKNAGSFNFADGKAKLTDAEMDALAEELKNAGKKNAQGNLNLGQGSVQTRMGRLLDKVPSLQKHLTVADLLKPEGLTALRAYDSNLFSLVKSRYGAASPKIVQDYNPYASEISMLTFSSVKNITSKAIKGADAYRRKVINEMGGRPTKQKGETTKEFNARKAEFNTKVEDEAMRRYLYDIGGARIQSFSDFMIENVFDYIQIFADLSAKRLPLHGYTKEIVALRLFGMTGAKWNGSLIAHVDRAMGKEYAGLLPASEAKDGSAILVHTEDGDYAIGFDDYARHKATNGKSFIQSIGMKDIVALQLDPRYSSYVGSITIGVSDKQILAMLDSPLFRFVIPYHSSGMLPQFAKLVGVDLYNDYTDYQNTTVNKWYDAYGNPCDPIKDGKGDVLKVDTSYNFNAEVQKTGDARKATDNYLKWCNEKHPVYDGKKRVGYVTFSPKFSNSPYGTDFTKHENYYKLLEDFNVYDNITEESAVQGAVTMNFPSESNRLNASEMEAYKARLRETGLFSEKEIEKYSKIANMTFKELIAAEVKGRAEYQATQTPKWENTVKNVEEMLLKDHKREGKMNSLEGGLSNKEASEAIAKYAKGESITTEKYKELVKTYGAIKKGEKPYRDVSVPSKTAEDKKVSQTVRTILEAEATPDEAVPTIEKMVEDGMFSYDVYTDQEAIENGEDYIKEHGWEQSLIDWFDAVNKGEVSKDTTTTGWILYNHAANSGDAKTALMILDAMVRHQRSAAQALQATRILKKFSPEAQLYGVQRSVSAFQNELKEKYGKKAPDLEIDEELAEKFLNAETEEERLDAEIEIYKDIGRQMPADWLDKWNAWRYLAMLGNLRTHGRNILGNAFFAPVVATKNLAATFIESLVAPAVRLSGKEMLRSKSIVWGSKNDRALLKAAFDDYAVVADVVSNGGKYNDGANMNKYIEEGKKVFKSKAFAWLEWLRKTNSKLLETEDVWFSKPHYAYALAMYCKANNITADQIARGTAINLAREYAIKEAQKATYKDTNAFSQFISELGRNGNKKNPFHKGVGVAIEGILPFRKTPANILARGVEYSPLGFIKGLADIRKIGKEVDGRVFTAHEAIDNISAGLTGTMLLALGIYLAAECLVRGHGEDDKEERKLKEMQGHQSYSLELPTGESITLDWLAPEALPFFVGVNLWETLKDKGKGEKLNMADLIGIVTRIGEPMIKMSCLQGINDMIESVKYAFEEESGGMAVLSNAVTSYLMQGLPTLGGQLERTINEERMDNFTNKDDFLTPNMQRALGKASAKIPGWDYNQIPYIDAWGRREASGSALKRFGHNFLNPSYTDKIESTEMEEELLRLFDQTGEASVFPKRADKSFTVDGEDIYLTAEQYVKYAELKGQNSYNLITELVQSDAYRSLDDKGKVKAIQDAYSYADQKAKEAISNFKPQAWVNKADEFGETENYITFRTVVKETENSHKDNGEKFTKADYVEIVSDMAETDDEAWKMYLAEYDSEADIKAEEFDIDPVVYMTARIEMSNIKADYIYNGERVDGNSLTDEQRKNAKQVKNSRKEKIVSYLNSVCDNEKDYLYLLGIEYSSITDDDDYVSYFGK